MTTDALKKMQEKLFRAAGDVTPRSHRDDTRESTLSSLSSLTIDIPKPPASPFQPPKISGKKIVSSPELEYEYPSKSYRERLAQRLAGEYHGAEKFRLLQDGEREQHWKKWGPYLSDRQWVCYDFPSFLHKTHYPYTKATVREDYSANGDAWSHFPHEHARSRAYRWGEDGIAGISDNHQRVCFALSLWNGEDPILKERLFGVTGHQGNHGEDVKELYYYLDSTPTHSYMKFLYKYPQRRYPYEQLVKENINRDRDVSEYEILDTEVFDDDRYWDVFVEVTRFFISRLPQTDEQIYISMPKTKKTLMISSFASRRIIAVLNLLHSILFLSFGSPTRGRGQPRNLPSPCSTLL